MVQSRLSFGASCKCDINCTFIPLAFVHNFHQNAVHFFQTWSMQKCFIKSNPAVLERATQSISIVQGSAYQKMVVTLNIVEN